MRNTWTRHDIATILPEITELYKAVMSHNALNREMMTHADRYVLGAAKKLIRAVGAARRYVAVEGSYFCSDYVEAVQYTPNGMGVSTEVESWLQSCCGAERRSESGVCDDGYSIVPVMDTENLFVWRDGEAILVNPGDFIVRDAGAFFVFGPDHFLRMAERI